MNIDRAFRRIPGAQTFDAHIKVTEITMPAGVKAGDIAKCTPVVDGTAVDFGNEGGEPHLYGAMEFDRYFKQVIAA